MERTGDDLTLIAEQVRTCVRCRLAQSRTHAVPGTGDPDAALVLVGEAPGAREDEAGLPFVGMAGRFLDRCLHDLGLSRASPIFVTAVNKCRPPGNRAPRTDEMQACASYLDRELALLQPRVVLAMGATAAARLHPEPGRGVNVGELRGLATPLASGQALLVTFHPAAAMRFPDRRQPFVDDLETACRLAGLLQSVR